MDLHLHNPPPKIHLLNLRSVGDEIETDFALFDKVIQKYSDTADCFMVETVDGLVKEEKFLLK